VALCDNESQGIVPVPETLGNGEDPRNNLYWGAMYGIKSFFKRSAAWSLVAEPDSPQSEVQERVVFKDSTRSCYLAADAYRGVSIKQATVDFLNAAAGNAPVVYEAEDEILGLHGNADLVVHIGHNGLMDFNLKPTPGTGARTDSKGAIVLACKSKPYIQSRLARLGCESILLTTGSMAPEACRLEAAVNAWIEQKNAQPFATVPLARTISTRTAV